VTRGKGHRFVEKEKLIGVNIQGPSMIRVPDWIGNRLGEYYLYFADHKGSYIRLAYADHPAGPWAVHPPGSLTLAQSRFLTEPPVASPEQVARFETRLKERGTPISHDALSEITTPHIASPNVHVDAANRRIVMYFHGLEGVATQLSRVAISENGIDFAARPEILGPSYFRIFPHEGMTYALAMPGQFFRSKDGLHGFEPGPVLFNPNMRHSAVLKRGNELLDSSLENRRQEEFNNRGAEVRRRVDRRSVGWLCRRGGRRLRVCWPAGAGGRDGGGSGYWRAGRTGVCGRTGRGARPERLWG
jgi:hypothetical protein